MLEFRSVRLSTMGRVVTGRTPPTASPELLGDGIAFITPTDVSDLSIFPMVKRRLSHAGEAAFQSILLPQNSVCFTCIASIGKMCLTAEPSITNQQINSIVVDQDNFDPRWVYYALRAARTRISLLASGSATPIINKTSFSAVEVSAPSLRVQRRTASVLGAYDDLIEVNRQRIALLEEMARGLFEEWFVHFRFPGAEMARGSEQPASWPKVKVGSLLAKLPRKRKVPKQEYGPAGEFPCVDQGSDFIGGFTDDAEAVVNSPLPLVLFGDHTRILKFINFPFACGADGTQLLYPNRADISVEFFYLSLKNLKLKNEHYARHMKFLRDEEIIIPPERLIVGFTKSIAPCFEGVRVLRDVNRRLSEARDLLLPRLVSGELTLSDAERELEAAA